MMDYQRTVLPGIDRSVGRPICPGKLSRADFSRYGFDVVRWVTAGIRVLSDQEGRDKRALLFVIT
ncbi:hypothetical protein [Bradyrhizobium sp. CB2312]|uniref:hypothetical protein n=1 Tax=Bradyrhizobium sp. CB2312 TaxID=3039155 RepID=UPI0024B1DF66|nr:hypothetical protein [Bradyrhizobium sp. CB2312]WFU71177.1 hypothetical protein QA642_38985 [Bradyrhizobium sp. CB2312]